MLKYPIFLLPLCLMLMACDQSPSEATGSSSSSQAAAKADPGQTTYNRWCISCHLSGISSAPRLGKPKDWADRLPRGRSQLIASVVQGMGVMPPRGLCRTCSDEDLVQAVDYMLSTLPEADSN